MDRPIVFIATAFSVGIVFGKYVSFPFWLILSFLIIFLVLSIVAFIKKLDLSFFILTLFFLAGSFSFQIKSQPLPNDISAFVGKGYLTVIGRIDDQPKVKGERISFPLRVERIARGWASGEASGMVYVSTQKGGELNYGDRIKVWGMLSQFQNYSNPLVPEAMEAYGLHATFCEKLPGRGGNLLKKASLWFSQRFNEVLLKILPQKEASLLGSLLLGSSVSPLSQDTKDTYRKAGLIHLLVVSGTQVSILIGICLAITRSFGLPLWSAITITSSFNLMLVIVTGAGPSILRAAIMGEITLIGLLFERQKEFYTSLALSALILLILNPLNLFDIGFQLSFAATWALVYIAPVLGKKVPSLLAISLAPILVTSPVIAFYFSQISFGAVISNLLVLPWVEFLVILGFSTVVLGFIFLPLAQVLGGAIWLMLMILDWVAKTISSFPGACFYIRAPTFPLIIGYYLCLFTLIELLKKNEKIKLSPKHLIPAFLFLTSVSVWHGAVSAEGLGSRELTVTFLDVGQGDCALVETPGGKKILIDGGGVDRREDIRISGNQDLEIRKSGYQEDKDAVGEKVVVPFLHRKGINHLNLAILTHPHADHLGGLNEVLEEIKVDQVLDGGQIYDSQAYRRFKALIEANKIKYSLAQAGQIINFGEDVKGYILNPILPFLRDTSSDTNNNSIVMRLVYGDVSFLFTGDIEENGEERILRSSVFSLRSTVLKVGHHGSRTSTTDEFLKAVNPRFAVISVGRRNRYHHPHPSTLQKLEEAGAKIYRTDENGAVEVRTDGKELIISPQR